MLTNPFTPSEIASQPNDFFGRTDELRTLERSLQQGSVAIQGPMGIGKSSLLARSRLMMEGFSSSHKSQSIIAVGDKDVQTIDQAARLLLESLVSIDERQVTVTFKLGSLFERQSAEICRNFVEGRHLAVLKRLVEKEYLTTALSDIGFLILAIDEADKCPVPLARLIRSIETHTQQQGVTRVRFAVAGVSPFFQRMVDEDPGVARFFYKTITLQPMEPEEAIELVENKLNAASVQAEAEGLELEIDPDLARRMAALSGGHPHLLQLLGSHLVEHENEDPDGIIDTRDLINSLRRICYEDRARVYDATIHMLTLHGKLDALNVLLEGVPSRFPTRIDRQTAARNPAVTPEAINWLVDRNVLSIASSDYYGLVDEFLRIRLLFDEARQEDEQAKLEWRLLHERPVGVFRDPRQEDFDEGVAISEDEYNEDDQDEDEDGEDDEDEE